MNIIFIFYLYIIMKSINKKTLRKGPSESATKFNVGTKKRGNDNNIWTIVTTSSGTHRWKKIGKSTKNSTNKTTKTTKKTTLSKTIKKSNDISVETLNQLKNKYNVLTHGSKKNMALGLWRVRGHTMANNDLEKILYLLPKNEQKKIEKLIKNRTNKSITNYKGMWKPLPKPLNKMSREELTRNLRLFRDAWEKITTRNQDLGNERLNEESTEQLRKLLKFYYSNDAKIIAEDWLRN
jgi:hypothetical protein